MNKPSPQTPSQQVEIGDNFLTRFGHLEASVRRIMAVDEHVPFAKLLRDFRQHLPTFGPQIDIIDDLRRLRNVVAHGNERTGRVIPTVETLHELQEAIAAVEQLTGDLSRFLRPVREFVATETIVSVLRFMHEHNFSQVAVRIDDSVDIVTAIDIASWLATQASMGITSIESANVKDVVTTTPRGRFTCLPKTSMLAEAAEAFFTAVATNYNNLFCILITENGGREESVLGIITLWDLLHVPKLVHQSI